MKKVTCHRSARWLDMHPNLKDPNQNLTVEFGVTAFKIVCHIYFEYL